MVLRSPGSRFLAFSACVFQGPACWEGRPGSLWSWEQASEHHHGGWDLCPLDASSAGYHLALLGTSLRSAGACQVLVTMPTFQTCIFMTCDLLQLRCFCACSVLLQKLAAFVQGIDSLHCLRRGSMPLIQLFQNMALLQLLLVFVLLATAVLWAQLVELRACTPCAWAALAGLITPINCSLITASLLCNTSFMTA